MDEVLRAILRAIAASFANKCCSSQFQLLCCCLFLVSVVLTGCESLAGNDAIVTIGADATIYATEIAALQKAAAIDLTHVVATIAAAGTKVSELSVVNAAIGATLSANYTPTAAVRSVVVNAEDMGSSLDHDMMDDMPDTEAEARAMRVIDVFNARSVDGSSGCATRTASRFSNSDERIYLTARVLDLQAQTYFDVDWIYRDRVVYRVSWQATYAAQAECIWFYATPQDFPFLPGEYSSKIFVNGALQATTEFSIAAN